MKKMTESKPSLEDALIGLAARLAKGLEGAPVRVGIGDDAAVLEGPPAEDEILITTDQIIENTHFVMSLHPPGALGRKTLVRGLSDIAAMGGNPAWFTLSLGVPEHCNFRWLEQFLEGMFSVIPTIAVKGFTLIGGDVARAPFFAAHVSVAGTTPRRRALLRSGATAGDRVFVSGRLGGSALGLERLLAGAAEAADPAVARHVEPTARIALGRRLLEIGASACLDLSDGLSKDALRLARASGVALVIDAAAIPQFPEAGLARALHGGEEYELLFTVPPGVALPPEYEGLALTCIGRVEEGEGLWLQAGGEVRALEPAGFEHFGG